MLRSCLFVSVGFLISIGAANGSEVVVPARGAHVNDLRPVISVAPVEGAENYVIEISTEPTFYSNNTLTYASANSSSFPSEGTMQSLRFSGLNKKYQRYLDRQPNDYSWKVPYNLTALLGAPDGYRIVPCRDWLKFFTSIVTEGRDDPLIAINEFVSFAIMNEGSGSGYYSAYETLTRDMGVCGNTADLVTALAAAGGYQAKILSLKAEDQGHVVASVKGPKGWMLLDGLYNIAIPGDAQDLINRVKKSPDFLNIEAFDGVTVPYRHFFLSTDYAYSTETTLGGISYTSKQDDKDLLSFEYLKFSCSSEETVQLKDQIDTRISTIFFVRATHLKDGIWAPWSYSYFAFDPPLPAGVKRIDNKTIWSGGFALPKDYLGGTRIPSEGATLLSSKAAQGYLPEYAFKADGNAWVADVSADDDNFIGLDFTNAIRASAVMVRWVTPGSTPKQLEIQSSSDGKKWTTVDTVQVDYPEADGNFRVDLLNLPNPVSARAWRLYSGKAPLAVEEVAFIAP